MSHGVTEFLSGETILLTGGTGFMGKALIDKVLRQCQTIKKIFVLIRTKRNMTVQERIKKIYESSLFETLKAEHPGLFETKVFGVAGDVSELNLSLSECDRNMLIDEVSLVVHSAATVRFDEPLKNAILINSRGTLEMCKLALDMKRIKCFMHISTVFCHIQHDIIEERMYEPYGDWRRCIKMAEETDEYTLNVISKFITVGFPNTYTFTKSLGENIVNDLLQGKIPNIIYRPSIVISTYNDPIPGWTENLNGPFGMFIMTSVGLSSEFLIDRKKCCSYQHVDKFTRSSLVALWSKCELSPKETITDTSVYNAESYFLLNGLLIDTILPIIRNTPIECNVWYPNLRTKTSKFQFTLGNFLLNIPFAYFLTYFVKVSKRKIDFVKIIRIFYNSSIALEFFSFNQWNIKCNKLILLEDSLISTEKASLTFNYFNVNMVEKVTPTIEGLLKHLLREDLDKDVKSKARRMKILYLVDLFFKCGLRAGIVYYIWKVNLIGSIYGNFCDYIDNL